ARHRPAVAVQRGAADLALDRARRLVSRRARPAGARPRRRRRLRAARRGGRWSLGFEVADLEAVRERLVAAGGEVGAAAAHPEGFRELGVEDPDGNRIRLFTWPH
ncbi:MAG: VOC family protein, partial [Planctomycetaceae bacterium]